MDIRENVLARLFTTLKTIDGIATFKRNRVRIDDDQRPALVLMDGEETAAHSEMQPKSPKVGKHMLMRPIVLLFLSKADDAGSTLNSFRVEVLDAICFDDDLRDLIKRGARDHAISYEGCEPGFQYSEATDADMALHFELTYFLDPSQFEASD